MSDAPADVPAAETAPVVVGEADAQPTVDIAAAPEAVPDSGLSPSNRKTKKVLVAKKVAAPMQHTSAPRQIEGINKRVIVARKNDTVSEPLAATQANPALAATTGLGPKRNEKGQFLDYTVLGPVHEFVQTRKLESQLTRKATIQAANEQMKSLGLSGRNSSHSQSPIPIVIPPRDLDDDDNLDTEERRARRAKELAKGQRQEAKRLNATMSKMLPEEKIVATKDERTFARWKAMQQQWDSFQKRMAAKLGKSRDDLMISAPNKYREEVEELDVIDKSIPAEKKFGTEYWRMSLRGHGSYFVCVGNIFSGLYLPIKADDKRPPPTFIRRVLRRAEPDAPLVPATQTSTLATVAQAELAASKKHTKGLGSQAYSTGVTGTPLTSSEIVVAAKASAGEGHVVRPWSRGSEFSHQRRRELGKKMAELKPYNLNETDMTDLEIIGRDLFADDTRPPLHALGYSSVFPNSLESVDETEAFITEEPEQAGPADEELMEDSEPVFDPDAPVPGPSLRMSRSRIVFETRTGQSAQSSVELFNNGSLAILFSLDSEVNPKFLCPLDGGLLLPGERKQLSFSFCSQRSGTFLSSVRLLCDPPVANTEGVFGPLLLSLKGMCVQDDDMLLRRHQLAARIDNWVAEPTSQSDYKSDEELAVEAAAKAAADAAAAAAASAPAVQVETSQSEAVESAPAVSAETSEAAPAPAEPIAATATDGQSAAEGAAVTESTENAESAATAAAVPAQPRTDEHWESSPHAESWPRLEDGRVNLAAFTVDDQRRYFLALNANFQLPGQDTVNKLFWHADIFAECQTLLATVFDMYKKSIRQSAKWDLSLASMLRWCQEIPVGKRPLVRGGARAPEAVAQEQAHADDLYRHAVALCSRFCSVPNGKPEHLAVGSTLLRRTIDRLPALSAALHASVLPASEAEAAAIAPPPAADAPAEEASTIAQRDAYVAALKQALHKTMKREMMAVVRPLVVALADRVERLCEHAHKRTALLPNERAHLQAGAASWEVSGAQSKPAAYALSASAEFANIAHACTTSTGQVLVAAANGQLYSWSSTQSTTAAAPESNEATEVTQLPALAPVLCAAAVHVKYIVPAVGSTYLVDDIGDIYRTDLVASLERVHLPNNASCIQLAACSETSNLCALSSEGRLYSWGENAGGECGAGEGNAAPIESPTLMSSWPESEHCVEIVAGASSFIARTQSGSVFTWGRNLTAAPVAPLDAKAKDPAKEKERYMAALAAAATHVPTAVAMPGAVVHLGAAASFALALCSDGRLLGWGRGASGGTDEAPAPTVLSSVHDLVGTGFAQVSCAINGACLALSVDGRVVAWSPSQPPAVVDASGAQTATALQAKARNGVDVHIDVARIYAGATRHFVALELGNGPSHQSEEVMHL